MAAELAPFALGFVFGFIVRIAVSIFVERDE